MTQNGITFNLVKVGAYPKNGTPVFSLVGQQGPDEDGGIINVVDIDWNGAQLSLPEELNLGTTINLLLAECIWRFLLFLETILNEKVHLTSGVHFCC